MFVIGSDDLCSAVATLIHRAIAGRYVARNAGFTGLRKIATVKFSFNQSANRFLTAANGSYAGSEFYGFQQQRWGVG